MPDLKDIVGFRNILVHGYAEVDDDRVWDTATTKVKGLIEALDLLLSVDDSPEESVR